MVGSAVLEVGAPETGQASEAATADGNPGASKPARKLPAQGDNLPIHVYSPFPLIESREAGQPPDATAALA